MRQWQIYLEYLICTVLPIMVVGTVAYYTFTAILTFIYLKGIHAGL